MGLSQQKTSFQFARFIFTLLISVAAAHDCFPAFAGSSPDVPLGEKQETELRIGLTKEGFQNLLKNWSPSATSSQRTDAYFDVFQSGEFLMRHNEPRAKLRIQIRDEELVVQKSWIDEQQSFESSGFVWNATTRTSAVGKFSNKSSTKDRLDATLPLVSSLAEKNKARPQDLINLQKIWSTQAWPKLDTYDQGTAHLQGPLSPAAVVLKERWLIPAALADGRTYKLQLGRDSDVLGKGEPTSFEIEVEFKNSSVDDVKDAIVHLNRFLTEQGLQQNQTMSQKSYDFFQRFENVLARAGD